MKICIFGAASEHIDDIYITETEELGYKLAKLNHELVFGAGVSGVMGAAARGFTKGGGRITGVIPDFFRDEGIEPIYDKCDELIYTSTMAERKKIMEDKSDVFVVAPGGVGTFEEFFEVIKLKELGRHSKPVIIFDINEYYADLEKLMRLACERKFIPNGVNELYDVTRSVSETVELIQKHARGE